MERAFILARSGKYDDIYVLMKQLKAEGFEAVEQHFAGPGTKKTIRDTMAAARKA